MTLLLEICESDVCVVQQCKRLFLLDCGLYVTGSSVTGFGSRNSDMDICLMLTNTKVCKFTINGCLITYGVGLLLLCPYLIQLSRNEEMAVLRAVKKALLKCSTSL